MTSLLQQITSAERERRAILRQLMEQEHLIDELKALRFECDHDFAPAYPGYEHEGGHCTKCGINEVYWLSNKKS